MAVRQQKEPTSYIMCRKEEVKGSGRSALLILVRIAVEHGKGVSVGGCATTWPKVGG